MPPAEERAHEVATRNDFDFNPLEGWSGRELLAGGAGLLLWGFLRDGGFPSLPALGHPVAGVAFAFLAALAVHYGTRRGKSGR